MNKFRIIMLLFALAFTLKAIAHLLKAFGF